MRTRPPVVFAWLIALAGAGSPAPLAAEPVLVDVGLRNGRKDTLTRDRHDWHIGEQRSATRSFGTVRVTLRPAGDDAGLRGFWWKPGLVHGATMAIEGVRVGGRAAGRGLEVVLSGLEPGTHSLATYHNAVGDEPAGRLRVSCVGREPVAVSPSFRANRLGCASRVPLLRGEL